MSGDVGKLKALFERVPSETDQKKLANIVMTGGARPLHMCGMSRGGDASSLIAALIKYGADVNAKDNYELTPLDRLASNNVAGSTLLREHGALFGQKLPQGVPDWQSDEFSYCGPGEVEASS